MLLSYPLTLPGSSTLLECFRLGDNNILHNTLQSSGTGTPPIVTISGTGINRLQNVELDIPVGGSRGTAQFRWRRWGGNWSNQILTAANVDLTSTELGISISFAVGTYQTDHIYRSVIGTITGIKNNILDSENSTTIVRPYIGIINGYPSLRGDGISKRIHTNTNALSTALIGGNDTAFTLIFIAQCRNISPSAFSPVISLCDGSAGNSGFFAFGVETSGEWNVKKRGDSAGTIQTTSGTADTNPHIFEIIHTGTAVSLLIDGSIIINSFIQDVPTVTARFIMLLGSSVPGLPPTEFYGDWDIGEVLCYSGVLNTDARTYNRQYLKNRYGI